MRALKRERAMAQRVSAAAARGNRDAGINAYEATSLLSVTEAKAYDSAFMSARRHKGVGGNPRYANSLRAFRRILRSVFGR